MFAFLERIFFYPCACCDRRIPEVR